jgi:hypothetical protein
MTRLMRSSALAVMATLWLTLPACVFPPWDERPGTGDDDDAGGEPSTIESLCAMAEDCGASPWSTVEECEANYPIYMDHCEDLDSFLACAATCLQLSCLEFVTCHDTCDSANCWWI